MSKHKKDTHYGVISFLAYIRPHWRSMLFVGLIFIIAGVFLAVIPVLIGRLVDTLSTGGDPLPLVIALIACSLLHDLTWHGAELAYMKYLLPLSFNYETLLFRKIINEPYHYFTDKFTGKVGSYITNISSEMRGFLSDAFFNYSGQIVSIVILVLILSSVNWQTGALFLVGLTLMFIVARWTLRNAVATERIEADAASTKNGHLFDSITNFASVKSFQKEVSEVRAITKQQVETHRTAKRAYLWSVVFWASMSIFVRWLIWPIAIVMNVILYTDGQMTIGQLTTILTAVLLFTTTIWDVVWQLSQLNLRLGRVEEAHTYLFSNQRVGRNDELAASPSKEIFSNLLTIKDLSFAYPDKPERFVLNNINLDIRHGEKIGIVGKSGSGKSTLTKLLLNQYPIPEGNFFLDNKAVDGASLSNIITFVPQDTALFHRNIADNIAYAANHVTTRDDIIAVAKKAQADEFIKELKDGYDSLVGERGIKLSGGQRQRIAIARALLKDAPIIVLDEATSALDSESEVLVQRALENLWQNKTAVVIAHRLSTIAKLDRIIVMDQGRIIEDGTHQELLSKNGIYAKLWAHQSGGFIEE